jgi:lipid-binding SYLF domain-containing protein
MINLRFTRRGFTLSALAGVSVTAACGNGIGSSGAATIDADVAMTLEKMYASYPITRNLADKSNGMLVMPLVTEAGLGFGGSYGRGALLVGGVTVDYYSAATISGGFQIGAQQYSHVLFFTTDDALARFRRSQGWEAGGEIDYVISDIGEGVDANTTTALSEVIAVVFNRGGLAVGATLKGTKYTRIIP